MTKEEEQKQLEAQNAAAAAEEATAEEAAAAAGENEEPETAASRFSKRFGVRHTGVDMEDAEAYNSALNEDYDEMERLKKGEDTLNAILEDPENEGAAAFMIGLSKKKGLHKSLLAAFGPEIFRIGDDEEMMAEIEKDHAEKMKRDAANRKLQKEFDDNLVSSLERMMAEAEKRGIPEEKAQKALELFDKLYDNYITGNYDMSTIDILLKGMDYDADVKDARIKGEARGRNEQHVQNLRKASRESDGLPGSGSGQGGYSANSVLTKAPSNEGNDIWSAGGYRRIHGATR